MTKQRSETTARGGDPMTLMMVTLLVSDIDDADVEEIGSQIASRASLELGRCVTHLVNVVAIPWTLHDARTHVARYEPWVATRHAEHLKSVEQARRDQAGLQEHDRDLSEGAITEHAGVIDPDPDDLPF
jgi:hypothetical protein